MGVLLFLALGAYPFLEAWVTDDDDDQHLLDRPRNRPVRTAVGIDLFAVPVLAFVVAKRCALGLRRRDRDKVLHGRESGVVRRHGHGEYVEVHEPLSQARLYALTAHKQYRPLEAVPAREGESAARGSIRRLRSRLSRAFYGPNTQIPKPTEDEYRQIAGSGS